MTEAAQQQRVNSQGEPCPPWCTSDHEAVLAPAAGGQPAIRMDVHSGPSHHAAAFLSACVLRQAGSRQLRVLACAGPAGLAVGAGRAGDLAAFLEAIADEPPRAIRALAFAVRDAARDLP